MLPTKIYTLVLGPGTTQRLLVQGRYFKIKSASGTVTVESEFGILESLIAGQGLESTDFNQLTLKDTSGVTNTVKIIIGDENFIDGMSGSVDIGTNKTPITANFANTTATVTNVSAPMIVGNALRQYLLIQNKSTTGSIYINFGSVATVLNGLKIGPGDSYEMQAAQSSGAINAIGDIASNANIVIVQG